jgi:hypothetical protein
VGLKGWTASVLASHEVSARRTIDSKVLLILNRRIILGHRLVIGGARKNFNGDSVGPWDEDEAAERMAPGDSKEEDEELRKLFSVQTTILRDSGIGNDFDDVRKNIAVM